MTLLWAELMDGVISRAESQFAVPNGANLVRSLTDVSAIVRRFSTS
jgi:hypothetical protein